MVDTAHVYTFNCQNCLQRYDMRNAGADAYYCGKWCREQGEAEQRLVKAIREVRADAKVIDVISSNGTKRYQVATYPDGHKTCTCRGFLIRRTCSAVERDAKDGEPHTL